MQAMQLLINQAHARAEAAQQQQQQQMMLLQEALRNLERVQAERDALLGQEQQQKQQQQEEEEAKKNHAASATAEGGDCILVFVSRCSGEVMAQRLPDISFVPDAASSCCQVR